MCTFSLEHLNLKDLLLRATQKIQNLIRFEYALFTYLDLKLYLFFA
jgi:hypothetical protein